MDSSTPQRVSLAEGRMSIAGLSTRFVQDPARRLTLEADGLETRSGYWLRDGALVPEPRITGRAWLPQDELGRAGSAEMAGAMPLALRPLPESGVAARILLVLAHGGEEPGFHATLWLPAAIFEALRLDVEAGRAGRLDVTATTSLWLDEADRGAPVERPVTWLLGPEPGGDETAPARGLAERIDWSPAFADMPGMAAEPEAEPEEPVGEALDRLNWSLRLIALLLVLLLIVAALK